MPAAPVDLLEERFENMLARLHEAYDGIGHSSGRPYLYFYFVYPPAKDQYICRLADDRMYAPTACTTSILIWFV